MKKLLVFIMMVAAFGCANQKQTKCDKKKECKKAAKEAGSVKIFNGKDLSNWTFDLLTKEKIKMSDVWSVKDGILSCKGKPKGYIMTKNVYSNYALIVEWRWKPGTKGGNNGVLVHASTPRVHNIWPKSLEVQLQHQHAGDFWEIQEYVTQKDQKFPKKGRRYTNYNDGAENDLGEWNRMKVICKNDEIIVYVNGKLVNHGIKCSATKGKICLQSEGAAIEYRKVELFKLK